MALISGRSLPVPALLWMELKQVVPLPLILASPLLPLHLQVAAMH